MSSTLRSVIIGTLFGFVASVSFAQPLDGIVAVIGEDIVLQSDVQNQYDYYLINGEKDDGNLKCSILENLIISKLMLNKAKQDSIEVNMERVDGEVERRVQQTAGAVGGVEKLEEMYKKSLTEIKLELRPEIRDQFLVESQKQAILSSINVTPREVKEFFKTIPKDSLPYLPAEVEMYHLVIKPPFSEKAKADAKSELEEIRRLIVEENKEFGEMAKNKSMGPSREANGFLGEFERGQMVPEFDDVVFNLREGQVSEVFETEFGFHIAKLRKRLGQRVSASHILIVPNKTEEDEQLAIDALLRIKAKVLADSVSFEKAAIKSSQDEATKDCGGCIKNPNTGENRIPLDLLDADLFFKIDDMEEGEISEPLKLEQPGSPETLYHIIFLKKRIPPHIANMKDDYQKLSSAAVQNKQIVEMDKWFKRARKNIFIEIMDDKCAAALNNWN